MISRFFGVNRNQRAITVPPKKKVAIRNTAYSLINSAAPLFPNAVKTVSPPAAVFIIKFKAAGSDGIRIVSEHNEPIAEPKISLFMLMSRCV